MISNEKMLMDLDGLCRFASVSVPSGDPEAPYGKEVRGALEYVLNLCEGLGFRVKNCGNRIGYAEIGQGEELVGILTHLDVVPAGDGWDTESYAATLKDGKLYGRGVSDDKGPTIASIYAMKDVLDSGTEFKRRVRIIFGQTEESGEWSDMEYYRATEELPTMGFTPDGDFPAIYGEKGIAVFELSMDRSIAGLLDVAAGTAANVVPEQARASLMGTDGKPVIFEARGKSAHGSMPEEGDNAISHLMEEIAESGLACEFARFYQSCIGFDYTGKMAGIGFYDKESGPLTLNAGILALTEDACKLLIDVRYPVTIPLEQVVSSLKQRVEPFGISVRMTEQMDPVYMAKDGELITKLMHVYSQITGDQSEPTVVGGGTYARAMQNIVAFGPMLPGRELTEHQRNESMLLEDFLLLRTVYKEAIRALACE